MNRWVKRLGYAAGGLIALVLVLVAFVYISSELKFRKTYPLQGAPVPVPADSTSIARGRYLVAAITKCEQCHGEGFRGNAVINAPPMGRLVAPNLTRGKGGVGTLLNDADWERAIRHGVGRDGRSLRLMPSDDFQFLADEDLGAIIAYAKSVPPADNVLEPSHLMVLPRALIAAGVMPLMIAELVRANPAHPPRSMPVAPTREYGDYITWVGGCKGCHGPTLSGGKLPSGDPSWPPASNLTPTGLAAYTEQSFVNTIKTGKRPDGTALRDPMPWRAAALMSPDEFHAVWLYLQSIPGKPFGGR